jgi:hypothetical protein
MNEMSKIKRNPAAVKIANEILKAYDCDSVADMQDALKEIFGPLFEGMLQGKWIIILVINPIQKNQNLQRTEEMVPIPKL